MDPFIGWTKTQLETALLAAQNDLASGKTISEADSGNARAKQQVQSNAIDRIRRILTALNLLDPTNYPISSIKRISRTRLVVYGTVGDNSGSY